MKLLVASAAMLASNLSTGTPAAHASAANYVITFTSQADVTNGDTCGPAICWVGGTGSYTFGGSNRCAVLYPSPVESCSLLLSGTITTAVCDSGTIDGTGAVTVGGVTRTVVSYHVDFHGGFGTFNGTLDDGSSLLGVVTIEPSDSGGHGVEPPAPGSPGNGACANSFEFTFAGKN